VGLGPHPPIPTPQSPIPNPQSPIIIGFIIIQNKIEIYLNLFKKILI
jgi:hypothetical protein